MHGRHLKLRMSNACARPLPKLKVKKALGRRQWHKAAVREVSSQLRSLSRYRVHKYIVFFFVGSQSNWMSQPQEVIPGCPPGLEYLTQIDQLLVNQQIELFEGRCSSYRVTAVVGDIESRARCSLVPRPYSQLVLKLFISCMLKV